MSNSITANSIYRERLRQATASFNLAFGLTAASAFIGFAGVLLMFSGNVSAGAVTTAGAATSGTVSASWLRLAKDANDRLDETAKALEDEENESYSACSQKKSCEFPRGP
ncbi:MAG: hypothetical protein F6K21_19595 [Symploca sp. SIO2D2]|nr:hypothetical protein [Symploca sp. SIO2D2]